MKPKKNKSEKKQTKRTCKTSKRTKGAGKPTEYFYDRTTGKWKYVIVKKTSDEEQKILDLCSCYNDLHSRIKNGLETGLSPEDIETVLNGLGDAVERYNILKISDSLSREFQLPLITLRNALASPFEFNVVKDDDGGTVKSVEKVSISYKEILQDFAIGNEMISCGRRPKLKKYDYDKVKEFYFNCLAGNLLKDDEIRRIEQDMTEEDKQYFQKVVIPTHHSRSPMNKEQALKATAKQFNFGTCTDTLASWRACHNTLRDECELKGLWSPNEKDPK